MGDTERLPFWGRNHTISPSVAISRGSRTWMPPSTSSVLSQFARDFSFGFLSTVLLSFGPLGGGIGYMLGLSGELRAGADATDREPRWPLREPWPARRIPSCMVADGQLSPGRPCCSSYA